MWNLRNNGTDNLIYKAEIEIELLKTNVRIPRRKRKDGMIGRLGLTYIHY